MPAQAPAPEAKKFAAEVQRILMLPDVVASIEALGMNAGRLSREEFDGIVRSDLRVYAKIIKSANIQIE